jgi:hypothetical protein
MGDSLVSAVDKATGGNGGVSESNLDVSGGSGGSATSTAMAFNLGLRW